jgi:hypothetical protein
MGRKWRGWFVLGRLRKFAPDWLRFTATKANK